MTKNMSAPLSFLQGLATPSRAGRLFISLIAASSFSADWSPITPTGLAKWHVPGKTHHCPASLREWGKVLRKGDGADTAKTYKCRCLGACFSPRIQYLVFGSLFTGSFFALPCLRRALSALTHHTFSDGLGERTHNDVFVS